MEIKLKVAPLSSEYEREIVVAVISLIDHVMDVELPPLFICDASVGPELMTGAVVSKVTVALDDDCEMFFAASMAHAYMV